MAAKEAKARIKINKLLEESGWRFFDDGKGKANIVLEPKVKLTKAAIDALGDSADEQGVFRYPAASTGANMVQNIENVAGPVRSRL